MVVPDTPGAFGQAVDVGYPLTDRGGVAGQCQCADLDAGFDRHIAANVDLLVGDGDRSTLGDCGDFGEGTQHSVAADIAPANWVLRGCVGAVGPDCRHRFGVAIRPHAIGDWRPGTAIPI